MSKLPGRAEKGLWNGGLVPLGYDCDKETQSLIPNDREVPIVRFFYHRMIETHSPCTVANEANAQGCRTKVRILTDRVGMQRQTGGKRFDEEDAKAIVGNPGPQGDHSLSAVSAGWR